MSHRLPLLRRVRLVRTLTPALLAALLGLAACGGGGSDAQAVMADAGSTDAAATATISAARANRAPKISGTPALHATAGRAYSFTPVGTDQDGNKLTYSVTNKPSWATFDASTGKLSGTPPTSSVGLAYPSVTISASDGSLSASLPPFEVYVYASVGNNQPSGIYSLDIVVNEPFVDGVVVRSKWEEMEPTEGVYDFSEIDKAVRDAAAIGQTVTIASMTSFAPAWLLSKATTFDYLGTKTAYPWDETMLKALEKLVNAQAAHTVDGVALRDHPAVKQVNASIGGVLSIRLIALPPNYTADKFTTAVERSIGFWAKAYPTGKHLYVGLFPIKDFVKTPSTTAEAIRDRLLKTYNGTTAPRLHFFQELLTGQTPDVAGDVGKLMTGVNGRAGVMFQACGPWSGQLTWGSCKWVAPVDTPELGLSFANTNYASLYFEVYSGDLKYASYRSSFESWHARIEDALN